MKANAGEILEILESSAQRAVTSASIGLFCEGDFYDVSDDSMWQLSRIFLFIALIIAGGAFALAWAISTFALPTKRNWKLISISSALAAVVQVPIFLVFETSPCKDYPTQECELATGSYLLICSILCSVLVTVLTVFLDPPDWVAEVDTWRIPKGETADSSVHSADEENALRSQPSSPVQSTTDASFFRQLRQLPQPAQRPKSPLAQASKQNVGSVPGGNESAPIPNVMQANSIDNTEAELLPFFAVLPSGASRYNDAASKTPPFDVYGESASKAPTFDAYGETASRTKPFDVYGDAQDDGPGIGGSRAVSPLYGGDESVLDGPTGNDSILDGDSFPVHKTLVAAPTEISVATTPTVVSPSVIGAATVASTPTTDVSDIGLNTVAPSARDLPQEKPTVPTGDRSPQKAMAPPGFLAFASRVRPERMRRNRMINGYAFMDDDDIGSSLPLSPPLEVTVSLAPPDEDHDFAAIHSAHEDDQDLLDDWNALHHYLPPPLNPALVRDPGPIMLSSDDEDSDSDNEMEGQDGQVSPARYSAAAEASAPSESLNAVDGGQASRRSPTKRRRRLRSTNSVSSGTSLLDLTIEEETDVDLREYESENEEKKEEEPDGVMLVRQRSAPNLAAFNAKASYKEKVCEDLHMDGVNSYHRVETWRSKGPIKAAEEEAPKPPPSQRMGRSRSLTPLRGIRRLVSRSPSPREAETASWHQPKRVPMWKEERELRGGIHANVSFSGDDSSGDENHSHASSPSLLARARQARIKRLQRGSPTSAPLHTMVPLKSLRSVSPDTGSVLLDTLDVRLAEVRRPIGAEYGPDECSL